MSTANVHDELANTKVGLLRKLCTNASLTSVVMGLLIRLIFVAENEKGLSVEGMKFTPWVSDNGRFTSKVTFSRISLVRSHQWGKKSAFKDYVGMKNARVASALHDNPEMGDWFEELVMAIESWARHKGYPFAELLMAEHLITKDDVVVLKLEKRSPFNG